MSTVTQTIRNGVDTDKLFATLDLIKEQPELAKFQFRASNRWIDGGHNRSTIQGFYAAGGEKFVRIPCLNDSDVGMRVIEAVVRRELQGWI